LDPLSKRSAVIERNREMGQFIIDNADKFVCLSYSAVLATEEGNMIASDMTGSPTVLKGALFVSQTVVDNRLRKLADRP
jgi:hypothetical protein